MELNKVYNEDCLEGMKRIPDNYVNITLTDIPYGEVNRKSNGLRNLNKEAADDFNIDMDELLREIYRVTAPGDGRGKGGRAPLFCYL